MKRCAIFWILVATVGCATASDDCAPAVMAQFPSTLAQDAHICTSLAVRLDGAQGPVYTVAAFSDSIAGELRLFDSKMQLLSSPTAEIYGVTPVLETIDVDGDGKPEVLLKMRSAQGNYRSWLFRWTGEALNLITPVDAAGDTLVGDAEFYDLDSDGKLELVVGTTDRGATTYRLTEAGTFASQSQHLACFDTFVRGAAEAVTFTARGDATVHHLRIHNGTAEGKHRATSATVVLNGETVMKLNDLNLHIAQLHREVSLVPGTNTLRVQVNGEPGARIQIIID